MFDHEPKTKKQKNGVGFKQNQKNSSKESEFR